MEEFVEAFDDLDKVLHKAPSDKKHVKIVIGTDANVHFATPPPCGSDGSSTGPRASLESLVTKGEKG